ncbi:MAG: hypothetical protein L6R36_003109 [Xanthoria steineri]|nr:MAG: hypothetical protein L6R36_003109 [Xanthoria steineri]
MQSRLILAFLAALVSHLSPTLGEPSGHRVSYEHRRYANLQGRDTINPPPSTHGTLSFIQTANVTRVLINNPPINLLTAELISDLHSFLLWTQPAPQKRTPKVVIFSSTLPNFFLSHFDLRNLNPSSLKPSSSQQQPQQQTPFTQLLSIGRLLQSTTSTAFIAQINGRTYGGGQELAAQMDMRFAGPGASIAQYENSNGFVAQAGGQLSLAPIIGKARALEHLLASQTIDAATGTRLGLFNNWYPDPATLDREVEALAARIGLFSQRALNDTKFSLAFMSPTAAMLEAQVERFAVVAAGEECQALLSRTLAASEVGGERFERGIPNSVVEALYGDSLRELEAGLRLRVLGAVGQRCDF